MKIKSEKQLNKAFDRLDQIWDCPPDSKEWIERTKLIEAIEEYENYEIDWPQ